MKAAGHVGAVAQQNGKQPMMQGSSLVPVQQMDMQQQQGGYMVWMPMFQPGAAGDGSGGGYWPAAWGSGDTANSGGAVPFQVPAGYMLVPTNSAQQAMAPVPSAAQQVVAPVQQPVAPHQSAGSAQAQRPSDSSQRAAAAAAPTASDGAQKGFRASAQPFVPRADAPVFVPGAPVSQPAAQPQPTPPSLPQAEQPALAEDPFPAAKPPRAGPLSTTGSVKRHRIVTSARELLRRRVAAAEGTADSLARLRCSTFSALSLEVGSRPSTSVPCRAAESLSSLPRIPPRSSLPARTDAPETEKVLKDSPVEVATGGASAERSTPARAEVTSDCTASKVVEEIIPPATSLGVDASALMPCSEDASGPSTEEVPPAPLAPLISPDEFPSLTLNSKPQKSRVKGVKATTPTIPTAGKVDEAPKRPAWGPKGGVWGAKSSATDPDVSKTVSEAQQPLDSVSQEKDDAGAENKKDDAMCEDDDEYLHEDAACEPNTRCENAALAPFTEEASLPVTETADCGSPVKELSDFAKLSDVKGGPSGVTCTPSDSASDLEQEQDSPRSPVHESNTEEPVRECESNTEEPVRERESNTEEPVRERELNRSYLLRFRGFSDGVPEELRSLVACEHDGAWRETVKSRSSRSLGTSTPSGDAPDRSLFGTQVKGTRTPRGSRLDPMLVPSGTAWKAQTGENLSRMHELQRVTNSLLNKVCPENVATIIERVASIELRTVEELELVITLIFRKALAEPHYCETYADMVFALKERMPEFPDPDGGKPITFKATLLNICQGEFEALPHHLTLVEDELKGLDLDEIDLLKKKKKDRVLANMKFIGHLFLRQVLSAKIIGRVIQDITNCDEADVLPEEPMVECICELLSNIGFTLASTPIGKAATDSVCGRLKDLKQRKNEVGRSAYSKRIQFAIQDLLDMKSADWTKKSFKASAKTKEEIKREQAKEIAAQARGGTVESGELSVAGARPVYLDGDRPLPQVGKRK